MISACLKTAQDYELIAYEFGSDCHRQNIRYAEVTFTMTTNLQYSGLPWQEILAGLNAGRVRAKRDFGVEWGWVFDINRHQPDTQDLVLDIALQARDQGVVALGLGGNEAEFPPNWFTRSFDRALSEGMPRVPHAGETLGAEGVWEAIRLLHPNRMGHGVRSHEDPRLVEYLAEKQIPIEVCPTSNVALGVFPDYASHPLRRLWDAGLAITLGSDDPPMFETELNREYRSLVDHFGFTRPELEQISLNGIRYSLLPEDRKRALKAQFTQEFANIWNA
jgi:adenosine deaminase